MGHAILKENLEADVQDTDFNLNLKTIGIVSINREEWLITDLACNLLEITSVPLYETLGGELLNTILTQTEIKTLFGSDVCLINVLKHATGSKLTKVVTFDREVTTELTEAAKSANV